MFRRGRRLRDTAIIRDLVRENELSVKDFILPIFVVEGENIKREIGSIHFSYIVEKAYFYHHIIQDPMTRK